MQQCCVWYVCLCFVGQKVFFLVRRDSSYSHVIKVCCFIFCFSRLGLINQELSFVTGVSQEFSPPTVCLPPCVMPPVPFVRCPCGHGSVSLLFLCPVGLVSRSPRARLFSQGRSQCVSAGESSYLALLFPNYLCQLGKKATILNQM